VSASDFIVAGLFVAAFVFVGSGLMQRLIRSRLERDWRRDRAYPISRRRRR